MHPEFAVSVFGQNDHFIIINIITEFTPGVIHIRATFTVHSRVPLPVLKGAEIRGVEVWCDDTSLHSWDLSEDSAVRYAELQCYTETEDSDELYLPFSCKLRSAQAEHHRSGSPKL